MLFFWCTFCPVGFWCTFCSEMATDERAILGIKIVCSFYRGICSGRHNPIFVARSEGAEVDIFDVTQVNLSPQLLRALVARALQDGERRLRGVRRGGRGAGGGGQRAEPASEPVHEPDLPAAAARRARRFQGHGRRTLREQRQQPGAGAGEEPEVSGVPVTGSCVPSLQENRVWPLR